MFKSIIKFVIVFVLTAVLAIGAASGAFLITRKILASNEKASTKEISNQRETVNAATIKEINSNKPKEPEYYMIKLEGEALGVYAAFDGNEDFLYTREVYKGNLSSDDIRLLTAGVRLESYAELTSFIEDYTS